MRTVATLWTTHMARERWHSIATILEADEAGIFEGRGVGDAEILLWNPCDGLNLAAWTVSIFTIWAEGQQGIWSAWRLAPDRPEGDLATWDPPRP